MNFGIDIFTGVGVEGTWDYRNNLYFIGEGVTNIVREGFICDM